MFVESPDRSRGSVLTKGQNQVGIGASGQILIKINSAPAAIKLIRHLSFFDTYMFGLYQLLAPILRVLGISVRYPGLGIGVYILPKLCCDPEWTEGSA